MTWRDRASCADTDPEVFFLGYGSPRRGLGRLSVTVKARALELCVGCPVMAECLGYALSMPVAADFGIWGGTTANQRIRLRQHQPLRSRRTLQEAAKV